MIEIDIAKKLEPHQTLLTVAEEECSQYLTELSRENKKLFSRQLNKDTFTEKDALLVCNQRVLLIGICGNSSEVLKNLIGNGTRNIYIFDDTEVNESDIRINYLFQKEDIHQRKDLVIKKYYPFVKILQANDLDLEPLRRISLNSITVTKFYSYSFISMINEKARQLSIPFIMSCQLGLSYFIFSDFGESKLSHRPIHQYFSNETTEELIYELSTYNQNNLETFIILCSIFFYLNKFGEIPKLFNSADADNFYDIVKENAVYHNHELAFEKQIYLKFAKLASIELPIVAEISGAMVACEILKGVVSSFEPVNQAHFWDNLRLYSALKEHNPEDIPNFNQELFGYQAFFGKDIINQIANLKGIVVGCGAVGCEQVKNLYQMGACSGEQGILYLADNDGIEITNLPRQILFKEEDINKNKAKQCQKWLEQRDPSMKVITYDILVNKENEHIFSDEFFDSLDFIIIAVDTIKARQYLADKAMKHNIFLVESGTRGFMAQSQCQVPYLSDKIMIAEEANTIGNASCTAKSVLTKESDSLIYSKNVFTQFTCLRENDGHLISNSDIQNYLCLYYHLRDRLQFCDGLLKQFIVGIFNYLFCYEVKEIGQEINHNPFTFDEKDEDHKEFVDSLFNILRKVFTNFSIYEKYLSPQEQLLETVEIKQEKQRQLIQEALPYFDKDDIDQGNVVYQLSKLRCKAFRVPYNYERYEAIGQIGNIIPAILESTSVASGFALINLFTWLIHKEDIKRLFSEVVALNEQERKKYLDSLLEIMANAPSKIESTEQEETQQKKITTKDNQRCDLFLTKQQLDEVKEKLDSFSFKDTAGQVKSAIMCFDSYTYFKIQDLSRFEISFDQSRTLSEILQSFNIILNEKYNSYASYIDCNNICIYDKEYKSKPLPQLVNRFTLYLQMNLSELAKQLELSLSSCLYFTVYQSAMNHLNRRNRGSKLAEFKIKVY